MQADSPEADSLVPNSWRYKNGVLIDAGNDGIDVQSLADEALPKVPLRVVSMSATFRGRLTGIRLKPLE